MKKVNARSRILAYSHTRILAALCLCAALSACSDSSSPDDRLGRVRASVRDEFNTGVGGVVLKLTQGTRTTTQTTTIAGQATFDEVAGGDYSIIVEEPEGYAIAPGQDDPVLFKLNPGQVKDIAVELVRVPKPPKEPGGGGEAIRAN